MWRVAPKKKAPVTEIGTGSGGRRWRRHEYEDEDGVAGTRLREV